MIKYIARTSTCLFLLIILSVIALNETSLAVGTIQIEKVTVPGGGVGFGFTSTIPGLPNFTLNDAETLFLPNTPMGAYVVTEDNPATSGYDLTLINCTCPGMSTCVDSEVNRNVMINLVDGEIVTCVFTNTGNGTIIIEKETVPVGGVNFGFTTDIPGTGNGNFLLDDGESKTILSIPAGTYLVTEVNPAISPGGFVLSDMVCDDMGSSTDVVTRTATIDLDPNETITCTFTNTLSLEGLNILKTDMPDPVVAGQELTYQILIENGSNIQATMMMLSDFLPMGVIPVDVSANRSDVECAFFADPLEAFCDIGNLSSGEAVIITIIVKPDPDEFNEAPTIIGNIATVTAEPGSVVREAMTQTLVNPIVMMSVVNDSGNSTTVKKNRDFGTVYKVTNNANNANEVPEEVLATLNQQSLTPEQRATALGVTFNLSFSSLFEVNSVETSKGIACEVNNLDIVPVSTIECPLGTINEGQTETVTINFRAPQEKDTYDFDSIVTSLLQEFENNFRVRVEGDNNNCSIAPVGASPSVPLYLFIPLFIVIRRFWRRVSE
jgi:uncharacterized repeat protein (TIGR01451 family)